MRLQSEFQDRAKNEKKDYKLNQSDARASVLGQLWIMAARLYMAKGDSGAAIEKASH